MTRYGYGRDAVTKNLKVEMQFYAGSTHMAVQSSDWDAGQKSPPAVRHAERSTHERQMIAPCIHNHVRDFDPRSLRGACALIEVGSPATAGSA